MSSFITFSLFCNRLVVPVAVFLAFEIEIFLIVVFVICRTKTTNQGHLQQQQQVHLIQTQVQQLTP